MKRFVFLTIALSLFISTFAQAEKLKVLIYNTWGVPIGVWDKWRYQAAMQAIEELNPDVVVLSEVFSRKGKIQFQSDLYPYHADGGNWFPRLVGAGTRILSKFPIQEHDILTYHLCKGSDCLARKGANEVLISLPSGKKINIVSTHLDSLTNPNVRISQINQLTTFADFYEDKEAPTIFAGDLNFSPDSQEYPFLLQNLAVVDSWNETHSPNEPGITYSCDENHYALEYAIKTKARVFDGRIDYLFHRGNIKALNSHLVFNDENHLFSDHYGILGEFEI